MAHGSKYSVWDEHLFHEQNWISQNFLGIVVLHHQAGPAHLCASMFAHIALI